MQISLNKARLWEIAPLMLIFALAVFLRTYNIFTTTQLGPDEGRDILAAKHFAQFSADPLATPGVSDVGGILKNSPVYFMLLSVLWRLSPSVHGIIITFALLQSCVVIVMYLLGKHIGGKTAGYCFAFLTAISPGLIELARWIWQPNLLALLIPLSLLLFLKSTSEEDDKYAFLKLTSFFIVTNLMLHLHYSAVPLAVGLFFLLMLRVNKSPQVLKIVIVGILVSIILRLVTGISLASLTDYTQEVPLLTIRAETLQRNILNVKKAIIDSLVFSGVSEDENRYAFTGIISLATLIMGGVVLLREKRHTAFTRYFFLLIALCFTCFFGVFFGDITYPHHYSPITHRFHLISVSLIFSLIQDRGGYRIFGFILIIMICLLNVKSIKNNSIYWGENSLTFFDTTAGIIAKDVAKNGDEFSVHIVNYRQKSSLDSFEHNAWNNSPLWVFVEEKLQKNFIHFGKGDSITETMNPKVFYLVSIYDYHQLQYTIQKVRLK